MTFLPPLFLKNGGKVFFGNKFLEPKSDTLSLLKWGRAKYVATGRHLRRGPILVDFRDFSKYGATGRHLAKWLAIYTICIFY